MLKLLQTTKAQVILSIYFIIYKIFEVFHYISRIIPKEDEEFKQIHQNLLHLIVSKNVDPNFQNNKGETCLHQAAFRGSVEGVKFLLNLTEVSHLYFLQLFSTFPGRRNFITDTKIFGIEELFYTIK